MKLRIFAFGMVLLALLWFAWAKSGRNHDIHAPETRLEIIEEIRADSITGFNIVAIQPYMTPDDYLSLDRFHAKLNPYFEAARENGFLRDGTVVLLPEYLGTWLVIAGEKKRVATLNTIERSMATIVLSNPIRFIGNYIISSEEDRAAAAIFRMNSENMANAYELAFRSLSGTYGVHIVAGSIVLPDPEVEEGAIITNRRGPLYNVTFLFHPDGNIDPTIIKKIYPIETELPFIAPAPLEALQAFDLPAGKTGLLVCADSWFPDVYQRLHDLMVDIVLVNSYCAIDGSMRKPWQGYSGADNPDDVDPEDIGALTEEQAWHKYALPGRLGHSGARVGVNVFLRGELWNLGTDGSPFIILYGKHHFPPAVNGAGIWNIEI